ncbi:YfbR-like 5'-deoxynucleotidase [Hwanghaeella grinnelliae]|uniref:YfbR-like 5'-deoxynucleotidase n=1 Tax=Hwanghaeella grinnelliae TaxID=2500179 RepID=UPI001F01E92E|nr:HD family hydrolase [Hwanghaeella grinnelliae]
MNQNTKKAPRAWQRMLSGRRLDLLDPSPLDVEIEDIAHGLARVARWNGQTTGDWAFSVAQHSLLVEALVRIIKPETSERDLLAALLHDAPEYVVGDMISPFKAVIGDDYKLVEKRLMTAIHLRFGLPAETTDQLSKLIKKADHASAYIEATGVAGFSKTEARKFFGAPPAGFERFDPTPLSTDEAKQKFLQRFEELQAAL